MKKMDNKIKDFGYFGYRLLSPILDPVKLVRGLYGYIWYIRDIRRFNRNGGNIRFGKDLYPMLHDKVSFTPFDAQYFFQQLWVFEDVLSNKPSKHVDVASTYELSGYLSKIVTTEFVDIRPIDTKLRNLTIINGSILDLPFKENSLTSVSCLHVIEHIGLGRYGDPIDSKGYEKAIDELQRVVKKGGVLYLSTPIGIPRVCFNAHRVFSPLNVIELFKDMKLDSFNVVDDEGEYKTNVFPKDYEKLSYGCGMFKFVKK